MKEKKPKHVRICPNCNSLEIYQETPGASANIVFGLPTLYKCKNCGFTNYIFPEIALSKEIRGCRKSRRFSSIDINEYNNFKVEKQKNEDEDNESK